MASFPTNTHLWRILYALCNTLSSRHQPLGAHPDTVRQTRRQNQIPPRPRATPPMGLHTRRLPDHAHRHEKHPPQNSSRQIHGRHPGHSGPPDRPPPIPVVAQIPLITTASSAEPSPDPPRPPAHTKSATAHRKAHTSLAPASRPLIPILPHRNLPSDHTLHPCLADATAVRNSHR